LFTDDNFELIPAEGEIWPGATTTVTVIFRPTEPKQYRQVSRDVAFGSYRVAVYVVILMLTLYSAHTCTADFMTVFRFTLANQLLITDILKQTDFLQCDVLSVFFRLRVSK